MVLQVETISCKLGCCTLYLWPYDTRLNVGVQWVEKKKAGVIVTRNYDGKVLIVRSRGHKWGFPKGSMESSDIDYNDCAERELFEETGMRLSISGDDDRVKMNNVVYFYKRVDDDDFDLAAISEQQHGNDASGVGWVRSSCLAEWDNIERTLHVDNYLRSTKQRTCK